MKVPSTRSPIRHSSTVSPIGLPFIASPIGLSPVFKQVAIGMACASYWRGAWYILDDHLFPQNTFHSAVASLGLGTAGLALCQGFAASSQNWKQKSPPLPSSLTGMKQWRAPIMRFGALYCVATSCVLVWRGAWLLWDVAYEEAYHYYINQSASINTNTEKRNEMHDQVHQLMSNPSHSHHHTIEERSHRDGHIKILETKASDAPSSGSISATDPHHLTQSGLLSHGIAMIGLLAFGRFASVLAPPTRASIVKDAPLYAKSAKEYMKTAKWLYK